MDLEETKNANISIYHRGQATFIQGGCILMLLVCMTAFVIGQAFQMEGNMDSLLHCGFLANTLMARMKSDNDPKYQSRLTKHCWKIEQQI